MGEPYIQLTSLNYEAHGTFLKEGLKSKVLRSHSQRPIGFEQATLPRPWRSGTGCQENTVTPEAGTFWVFNDSRGAGGPHSRIRPLRRASGFQMSIKRTVGAV